MERPQLKVELREGTRKGPSRRLRSKGAVPAILYGKGVEPLKLSVGGHELERIIESNQLLDLRGPSQIEGRPVLIKEFQRDPVSSQVLHCDFYVVDTSRKLEIDVPVHLEGKPHGVELGGVLESLNREVTVSCLPDAIPSVINADVSGLDIGDVLHASDLILPDGVELASEPGAPIAHVIAARVETAEGEEEAGQTPSEEASAETPSDS